MRRGIVLFAGLVLAASAACRPAGPVDVRVAMPGVSPFPPGSITGIIVAGFRDEAPLPDFETARALEEYLAAELERAAKGKMAVIRRGAVLAAAGRDEPSVWKEAGAGEAPGTVFLAGSVRLSGEIRKALDKRAPPEGPFNLAGRGLIAKRHWLLAADISIISAATGETLHRAAFREERDYDEIDKPAEFAFSELSERVRTGLFQALLGSSTIEIRTLLRR